MEYAKIIISDYNIRDTISVHLPLCRIASPSLPASWAENPVFWILINETISANENVANIYSNIFRPLSPCFSCIQSLSRAVPLRCITVTTKPCHPKVSPVIYSIIPTYYLPPQMFHSFSLITPKSSLLFLQDFIIAAAIDVQRMRSSPWRVNLSHHRDSPNRPAKT